MIDQFRFGPPGVEVIEDAYAVTNRNAKITFEPVAYMIGANRMVAFTVSQKAASLAVSLMTA